MLEKISKLIQKNKYRSLSQFQKFKAIILILCLMVVFSLIVSYRLVLATIQATIYLIPYRTKIRRTKLSKFRLGVETFVGRKILYVENFVQYVNTKVRKNCQNFCFELKILSGEKIFPSKILSNISIQKSGKNRTKLSKFWLKCRKFCPTKHFVQYVNTKVR